MHTFLQCEERLPSMGPDLLRKRPRFLNSRPLSTQRQVTESYYSRIRKQRKQVHVSKKRILITGADSGFGEGAAISLAQNGHDVIAGAQIWPQVTSLRQKVKSRGLNNLRVEKLDLLHPYDVDHALKWDIDILFSNAGIGENGPICEFRSISSARRLRSTSSRPWNWPKS